MQHQNSYPEFWLNKEFSHSYKCFSSQFDHIVSFTFIPTTLYDRTYSTARQWRFWKIRKIDWIDCGNIDCTDSFGITIVSLRNQLILINLPKTFILYLFYICGFLENTSLICIMEPCAVLMGALFLYCIRNGFFQLVCRFLVPVQFWCVGSLLAITMDFRILIILLCYDKRQIRPSRFMSA